MLKDVTARKHPPTRRCRPAVGSGTWTKTCWFKHAALSPLNPPSLSAVSGQVSWMSSRTGTHTHTHAQYLQIIACKLYHTWHITNSSFLSVFSSVCELAGSVESHIRRNHPRDHLLCLQSLQQQRSSPPGAPHICISKPLLAFWSSADGQILLTKPQKNIHSCVFVGIFKATWCHWDVLK